METKVLQVFYGKDCLPYKDKERSVHFPIVGAAIQGASNTTKIRFYFDQLVEEDDQTTTWVVVSKLPNGKIGSEIVETQLDTELNEHYAQFSVKNFYTQAKGDLFLSLQGYQGGVQVETDPATGISQIIGTPTIQATGSIKLAINYATQLVGSGETANINFQKILADLGTKLGIRAYTERVTELPTTGQTNVFYAIYDDPNNPNKLNIYVWNGTTQSYVWVGDNTIYLGDYYTKEQGEQFEEDVSEEIAALRQDITTVKSASPRGVYSTVSALESADPSHEYIYLVTADGHWYYWNGSAWTDGGLYQTPVDYDELVHQSNKMIVGAETSPYDDCNTFPNNEIVSIASGGSIANKPMSTWAGNITTFSNQGSGVTIKYQIGVSSAGKVWTREYFGDSWSEWKSTFYIGKLYNQQTPSSPYNDCDTLPINEIVTYFASGVITNRPTNVGSFTILTLLGDTNDGIGLRSQIAINLETGELFTRAKYGASWSSWSVSTKQLKTFIDAIDTQLDKINFSLIDLSNGNPWSGGGATVTNKSKYAITLANGLYNVDVSGASFEAEESYDIYYKADNTIECYYVSDYTYSIDLPATNGKFERTTLRFPTGKTPALLIGNNSGTVNIEMYIVSSGTPLNPRLDLDELKDDGKAQKLIQISDPTLVRTGGVWLCTGDYPSWYGASGFNGLKVDVSNYKKIAIYGANTPGSFAAFVTGNNYKISNLNNSDKVYNVPANAKYLLISGSGDTPAKVFNFDYVTLGIDVTEEENEYGHLYGLGTFDYIVRGSNAKDITGYCSMAMFPKMAVIGDSYSSGLVYNDQGGIGADYQLSWLTMMARRNGAVGTCYSYGGANTHTWLENQDHGLPAMLADTPKNLYFIMLGINDSSTVTLGTIADATDDYDHNPDTYYGNYARIIRNIQVHAPNSKIILVCPPMSAYNGAVVDLANKYGLPYITTTDDYFSSQYYILKYGHPVASSYAGMSMIYEKESIKAILNNPDYFNDYVCDGPLS